MDKQSYKRILADEMAKTSELKDKINQIKSLIENNSNDMILGKKIRTMYWDDKQNDNQLGLFSATELNDSFFTETDKVRNGLENIHVQSQLEKVGKRFKKGFTDTRGTMFFEIQRILAAKQPKAFLLENVKQLKGHDKGKTLKTIFKTT